MIRGKIAIFFLFLFSLTRAQKNEWYRYNWSTAQPPDYDKIYKEAAEFAKEEYKDNIYVSGLSEKTAAYLSTYFVNSFSTGKIYPGFDGFENYIRRVLLKVVPDTAIVKKIKIYFNYDPEFNAYMDGIGNLSLNIGKFCYINNEAELAGTLAHEYAHFLNKDNINNYTERKQQEATADYVAIKLIKNSPYSLAGMASTFRIFKRFEIKAELVRGINKVYHYTHPDPGERLKQVKLLSNDSTNVGKKLFVVDSIKFFELKRKAYNESINNLIEQREFQDAVELSFTYYLFNPADENNLAVLRESIRRHIQTHPTDSNKQFIIDRYKGEGAKKSVNYNYIMNDSSSILKFLTKGLLFITNSDLVNIKAKDLLDSGRAKFRTNIEAYNYFSERAVKINCKPCLVSDHLAQANPAKTKEIIGCNSVFDCNTFLASAQQTLTPASDIYILNFPAYPDAEFFELNKPMVYTQFLNSYYSIFKDTLQKENVFLINKLGFKDQHLASSLDAMTAEMAYKTPTYPYYKTDFYKGNVEEKKKISWTNYSPELYELFYKYKASNIYFVDVDVVRVSGDKKILCRLKRISADPSKENVVYKHVLSPLKSPEGMVKECAHKFKVFISEN